MFRTLFLGFFCFLVVSCGQEEVASDAPFDPSTVTVPTAGYRYEVFQVIDSAGVSHGMGYDIYDGQKKIIHQTTIPGEQGVEGFVNEEEAGKVGELVVQKLQAGGGFPTITHVELVGLGITLEKY